MSDAVFKAIDQRWSCRAFQATPLPDEIVAKLVGVMLRAPSAGNVQPWHFYVVTDSSTKSGLAEAAYGQDFVSRAPVVFVVCAIASKSGEVYGERGKTLYCIQDTAAAVENLLIAAEALELGTCWVGAFDEVRAAKVMGLTPEQRPVAIIPVGKPAAPKKHSRRQPPEDVVSWVR